MRPLVPPAARFALSLALLAAGCTDSRAEPVPPRIRSEAAHADESPGESRLDALLERRRRHYELEGQERVREREAILAALDELSTEEAVPAAVRAEAAFRAGETYRADGRDEEALARFERTRRVGRDTPFGERAVLESAHVHRRRGEWDAALDAYLELAYDATARRAHRDAALYWSGRVALERGDRDSARRRLGLVARFAERPLDRVRAYDGLAMLELEFGNRERANAVLEACDAALASLAAESTTLGDSVRRALARMRARRSLSSPPLAERARDRGRTRE